MTLQTVPGGFFIPFPQDTDAFFQDRVLNAGDEAYGVVLRAPKAGTISKIGFLTGLVTTGATVDLRMETVDTANGEPSGTLFNGSDSNVDVVIADDDDDTWKLGTLVGGGVVTKGQLFAVRINNPSVSPGDLGIVQFRVTQQRFPYVLHETSGTWVKQGDRAPVVAFEYSDGSYDVVQGIYPLASIANLTFSNASSPDERGIRFKLPFPVRVTGAWVLIDADGDVDIVLYDSGDTAVATASLDKDVRQTISLGVQYVSFPETVTVPANTVHRLMIKPTSSTSVKTREFTADTVAIMDAFGGGQDFHFTSRVDGGSFDGDDTKRGVFMGLICDAFDDGVSGDARVIFLTGELS